MRERRTRGFCFLLGLFLSLNLMFSSVCYGIEGDSPFLYERKHIRNSDLEELGRQLACFWVAQEVSFPHIDTIKEDRVTALDKWELKKLNRDYFSTDEKNGSLFSSGYKMQLKKTVLAGMPKRPYMASDTLCVAYREEADGKNTFLIALRGSIGETDWSTNLNLIPGYVGGAPSIALQILKLNKTLTAQEREYHIGYFESAKLLMPALLELTFEKKNGKIETMRTMLQDRKQKNSVFFCGYSKGAAVSQILSMRFAKEILYIKNGDEKRNGLCSYNFATPYVYNSVEKNSKKWKSQKAEEKASMLVSLYNFNIEGDLVNHTYQIYHRNYGESYLIRNSLTESERLLRMMEIHEAWYRDLKTHLGNGDLKTYEKIVP